MSHDSSLEPILRAVEPAVRLIPERHLRQVLHYLIDWGHLLPTNTHLAYWVSLEDLAAAEILAPQCLDGAGPQLLLLTDPDDRMLAGLSAAESLRAYWRALYRAAIVRALEPLRPGASLLAAFGAAAAREIEYVLTAEHLVAPGAGDAECYRQFAAAYLELAAFEPQLIERYFPTLPPVEEVRAALSRHVDAVALLASSRPAGAADALRAVPGPAMAGSEPDPNRRIDSQLVLGQARAAEGQGNRVRAAILMTQAAGGAPAADRDRLRADARAELQKLVDALGDVFAWEAGARAEWTEALTPLLDAAALGSWSRAARCLHELQKIPADLARDVYAVDLPEYIRTFGRRPVKRLLPRARPVLILMSWKKAQNQLLRAGLGPDLQSRINHLFHHEIHALEHRIRQDLGQGITGALTGSGFVPHSTVELVARDKIVAELLDRICDRGYLRLGNLRDAIARNRLKMADLSGMGEFLRGDALLRADVHLAEALDGIYRQGEIYLRGIQRFSSLFFGTNLGRGFTLFLALPFGGAFLTLMFLEELRHIGGKLAALAIKPAVSAKGTPPREPGPDSRPGTTDLVKADEVHVGDDGEFDIVELNPSTVTSDEVIVGDDGEVIWYGSEPGTALVTDVFTSSAKVAAPAEQAHGSILVAGPTIVGFGLFLLLMFHAPPFRRGVFAVLRHLWRIVRTVLWSIPVGLWRSRTVRGFIQSRPLRFLVRHFWSPLLITLLTYLILLLAGVSPWYLFRWWWAIWAGLTIAYNTPWGWVVQDRVAEAISDWWRIVRVNLLPGLIATIIDWFKMLANWIERQLYAVDEWLRFRGGDSQSSLATKALLGLIWFPIAYAFRFVFYLLVEPQVNPVKHFPVVTVSHKVIWPLVPEIVEATGFSVWTVSTFVNGIPGIFGFIAWELKENWRLYAANRAERLRPVTIGSHGESMRGLLRPGFHSGTVPTIYRKLRHADTGRLSWLYHDLEHATEAVERFVERELIALLERSSFEPHGVRVGSVRPGCQRLVIDLEAVAVGADPFQLSFENIGGRIESVIEQAGWVDKLSEAQRGTLVAALRGLLDMAVVDRINGCERFAGTVPSGPGFSDLARRVGWDEWVDRWKIPAPDSKDLPASTD